MDILAMTAAAARRFGEIGFAVGALGALLCLVSAIPRGSSKHPARAFAVLGFFLIAVAFVLGILYVHWI
jgi:hypothetical protein